MVDTGFLTIFAAYGIAGLIELLLFVTGLIAGILLRRRDGAAALLIALGFGLQILNEVLSYAEQFAPSAPGSIGPVYELGLLLRPINLAGTALIFAGLLRLVRRRPVPAEGATR